MGSFSPVDRDLAIRTVIGEANGQPDDGQAAVAHVILNRIKGGWGNTPSEVVLQQGQFEPWSTRARELLAIDPKSPQYQAAAKIVDGVMAGEIKDPTRGATYFLNPDVVQKRSGKLPGWATGQTVRVGDHAFYYGGREGTGGAPMATNEPGQSGSPARGVSVTPEDIDETLRILGVGKPKSSARVPVSDPVVADPAAATVPAITDKDMADTAEMLGIKFKPASPPPAVAKPSEPPTTEKLPDGRTRITIRPEPKQTYQPGMTDQLVEGMPVVGPVFNKAVAATQAGLQPVADYIKGNKYDDTFGQRYENNLQQIVQGNKDYANKNPVKSLAANLMGGTMLMAPLGVTKVGGALLGTYGPSLGSRVLTGGVGGAGISAVDALLRNESLKDATIIGGAGGAAGPLISSGARAGTSWVTNNLLPRSGPLRDVPNSAVSKLVGAMEGENPVSVRLAKTRMGPAGFMADLNPAMTDLAGGVADIAGPAKHVVREAYDMRAGQHVSRVKNALDKAMGGPAVNVEDLKNFHIEKRSEAADSLYRQWRESQVHPTDELKALIPRLEKAGAFDMAEELSGISGKPITKKFFTTGSNKDFPTTESWDYVKRGLDRRIDQAYRAGDNTLGRELVKLKNELITEIGNTDAGKIWQKARAAFAERSQLIDQIEAGKDTFLGGRNGISADQLREELKGLSVPELQARIIGARAAAEDVIGATMRGDATLRNKMLAPNNVKKMELLLGKDKAGELIRAMEQEHYLANQYSNVIGNQNTGASNMSRKERVEALKPSGGNPWNFDLTQPVSYLPPFLREEFRPANIAAAWRGQNNTTAINKLAELLTMPQSPDLDRLLRAIHREGSKRAIVDARAAQVGNALGGLISGPGTTAVRRQYAR